MQIPKASTHPRFAQLPELESFATMIRNAGCWRSIGPSYRRRDLYHSAAHPTGAGSDTVRCHQRSYKDPEFFNDYKKLTGEAPSPLTPDEFDEVLKKLPRDPQDVDLFKKIAGTGPAGIPLVEI